MSTPSDNFTAKIVYGIIMLILGGGGYAVCISFYNSNITNSGSGNVINIINSSNISLDDKKIVADKDNVEDTVKSIITTYQETKVQNEKLEQENKALISRLRTVQYINPKIKFDGVSKSLNIINPIALIDNDIYISEKLFPLITKKHLQIDMQSEIISVDSNPSTGKKYALFEVCRPHDGRSSHIIPGDSWVYRQQRFFDSFQMSGKKYTEGIIFEAGMYNGAFSLISLDKKYSSVSFIVGHIDGTDLYNGGINLKLFADKNLVFDKYIGEDSGAKKYTVALNYAQDLKIQVTDGGGVFGMANMVLTD